MNLPIWREKDGDNGMGRVASIIHTFHHYLVGMDNNVKKDLTSCSNLIYYKLMIERNPNGVDMSWITEVLGGVMMFGMVYVLAVIMFSL